jgi:copper(I)-binding protein
VSVAVFAASAAMAAGLLLSGCGAGQVTQTENQNPPISGVNVDSKDRSIQLRNVAFQYGGTAGYKTGQAVPLHVRIVNQNLTPIRLVGVTTDAGAVVIAGKGVTPPAPSVPPSSPAPSASGSSGAPSGSASGPASASGSASGSVSAPPSAPPSSAPPSGPPANPTIDVEIPVRGLAVLDPSLDRYLQIAGLSEELKPGDTVEVTFRFQTDAGEVVLSTPVPVAIPLSPPPRSPLHLEEGEGH